MLATRGLGPKSLRALSLIASSSTAPRQFCDPARFSYAHGGKDGHPYPVDRETYGQSIEVLRRAVSAAKMGEYDRTRALRRLAAFDLEEPRPRGVAQPGPSGAGGGRRGLRFCLTGRGIPPRLSGNWFRGVYGGYPWRARHNVPAGGPGFVGMIVFLVLSVVLAGACVFSALGYAQARSLPDQASERDQERPGRCR